MLPRFVGRWFPRNDESGTRELYCASMLLLLQPWRKLQDLKDPIETFAESFERFTVHNPMTTQIMENIQYYHACYDAALARPKENDKGHLLDIDIEDEICEELLRADGDGNPHEGSIYSGIYTEDDIEAARNAREADRERIYGEKAILIAKEAGIFEQETDDLNDKLINSTRPIANKANAVQLDNLRTWNDSLIAATRQQIKEDGIVNFATIRQPTVAQKGLVEVHPRKNVVEPSVDTNTDKIEQRLLVGKLNKEQRRAHDIIEETLKKEISGKILPKTNS